MRLSCFAFDRFVCVLLGALVFLWVAERLMSPYDVNGVLCAVAMMLLAGLALPALFLVAFLRRKPVRASRYSLFILVSYVALTCGWFQTQINRASRQRLMLERLDSRLYNRHFIRPWNVARNCPPVERMLEAWLGSDFFDYPVVLGLRGEVDEEICAMLGQMPTLEIVSFESGRLGDSCLMHFEGLRNLRRLVLPNRGASQEAVNRLQRALPNCKISWREPEEAVP